MAPHPLIAERKLEALRHALGNTVLAALVDGRVLEILANPDGRVILDRAGEGRSDTGATLSAEARERAVRLIADYVGETVTREDPRLSGVLPSTGERFQGLLPPVASAPAFSIRKRPGVIWRLSDYVRDGTMTARQADVLAAAASDRRNILISGGTGSGKTTLANAVLAEPTFAEDRVFLIEDTPELQCSAWDTVAVLTRRAPVAIGVVDLVRDALRMRPDRIVVGEMRDGAAALETLKSWNTGHPGGLSTIHANSAEEALRRVEDLAMEIVAAPPRRTIAQAVDLIAHISRTREPAAAEGGEAEQGEEGHAEDAGGGEGVVVLTPAQIQAASIAVVAVTGGGGGETRLAGRVEPMVDARAAVAASVGGRVERVLVTPGQSVRAGQPLAVLVSGDAATFRADADAAAASADAARRAYQRDQNLEEAGVVARQDVETSRAQALSAEASARAARARAAAAGSPSASGRLSVTSPINGVVTSVQVGPGGFAAQGGVIAEITNPARVEIVFNAPPALAAQVRPGAQVQVQGSNGEFEAVVTGVAVDAGEQSGATVIRARPTSAGLPPAGSAVSGSIVTGGLAGGLTVPSEAVQTIEGATVVFVRTAEGFRAAPVLVGRQAGDRTEILRGLTGSERIAGANAFLLKAELAKGEAGDDD